MSINARHARAGTPLRRALFVSAGGALGALARFALLSSFPNAREGFPAGSLVVNGLGSLALGLTIGWLDSRKGATAPVWMRTFLLAGFLGAFTTLSLVVVDHAILMTAGRGMEGLLLALITIVGTMAVAWIGIAIATRAGDGAAEDAP